MAKTYLLIAGIFCLLCLACSSRHRLLGKRDLEKYISDPAHGLIQKTTVEEADVSVDFEPSSMLAANEFTAGSRRDSVTLHGLQAKYSPNYYFLVKFSKNHKELIRQLPSFSDYSEMVQVLSFRMQQYINLTTDRDTLQMSDYTYEQTYGMGNANMLLIAFPKKGISGADRLDINLAECGFGLGSLKFSFRKSDLDKVPELDYTKLY